ncbi:MAG: PQ-loop domain-containing transporter [Candidatus Woesearchaeota archaeon]
MRHGEHHLHIRKRIHVKHEQYPHPNKKVRFLDRVVLITAIVFPLTTIPQIYDIWSTQDASGLSLTTWVLYAIFAIPMLLYGFVHRQKPIFIMNILWLVVYAFVIWGTVLYG